MGGGERKRTHSPQRLCFSLLVLSVCLRRLFVIVDTAAKLGNLHERQTCLFLILWFILRGWEEREEGSGWLLFAFKYLFTSAKKHRSSGRIETAEALSQLPPRPPPALPAEAAAAGSLCEPSGTHGQPYFLSLPVHKHSDTLVHRDGKMNI